MPAVSELDAGLIEAKRAAHAAQRSFGADDWAALLRILGHGDEVVSVAAALDSGLARVPRLIALRHDVDHDLENSVRLAELEAERGYRATYFILHTDWYYCAGGRSELSTYLLRGLDRIVSLGHEIALHNNAVAAGLRHARDPVEILGEELLRLRRHGFEIRGTVAHGDELCHRAGFLNDEVFVECARPQLGPADRTVVYDDWKAGRRLEVKLDPVHMGVLGLEYEANRIGHQLYLSDAGGCWQSPFDLVSTRFVQNGGFLQILVHPVWWALSGESHTPRRASALYGDSRIYAAGLGIRPPA